MNCSNCGRPEGEVRFSLRTGTDKYYTQCNSCRSKGNKKRTPEQRRSSNYKTLYGISLQEYNQMLREQGGKCKICGTPHTELGRGLYVDHCHLTGEVRGLLCQACNVALGLFKDSTKVLEQAIRYLTDTNL